MDAQSYLPQIVSVKLIQYGFLASPKGLDFEVSGYSTLRISHHWILGYQKKPAYPTIRISMYPNIPSLPSSNPDSWMFNVTCHTFLCQIYLVSRHLASQKSLDFEVSVYPSIRTSNYPDIPSLPSSNRDSWMFNVTCHITIVCVKFKQTRDGSFVRVN